MKLVLQRQIQLAFAVALALLLTIGFFAYRSAEAFRAALKWEQHTQEVLRRLEDTQNLLTDVESSGRGFVITGNEDFLEPYRNVEPKIDENLTALRELVADNPKQTAEFANLETAAREKLAFTRELLDARRGQSIESATKLINDGRGKEAMKAIRASVGKMKDEERGLLKGREENLDKSIDNVLLFLFFGTGAGIVSIGLANWAIFREVGKRRGAEEELRDLNRDLEHRVQDRTLELSEKNKELNEQIKGREQAD